MEWKKMELTRVIKVDLDYKPIDPEQLAWRMRMIEEILGNLILWIEVYETAKGYHLYAYVETVRGDLDDKDVIIIQMALGSDYMRELYNLRRVKNGDTKNWNVLFKAKYKEIDGELVKVSEEVYDEETTNQIMEAYVELKQKVEEHLEECKKVVGDEH